MSRQLTTDEVRNQFLDHIWNMINYWDSPGLDVKSRRESLEGLAHSFMATFDGCTYLPRFILAPDPHPEDKAYHQAQEENWYPETPESETDISGHLRYFLHNRNLGAPNTDE